MTAPAHLHDLAADQFAQGWSQGVSLEWRETFGLRLDRYYPDLVEALAQIHPDETVRSRLTADLVSLAASAFAERADDLHRLDTRRLLTPDWLQQPRMFGYACYADRFAGDLPAVADHLDHLERLGVTYLHLMPLLEPREGDNDGGYAVKDYGAVRRDLGTMEDLRDLATALRERGISLCIDLVLNHVAREHEWARAARAGDSIYRDYFHVFADRSQPDAFERTLPEVFPDFAPGNFSWDEELQGWVWTTFNEFQWDLNWANPRVLLEFAGIVLDLANVGIEVLRLDAIAFLWKRLGTNSQNQPEVHAITQVLRAVAHIAAPALVFKAEAIVGPRDLVQYLGTGAHAGKVSDLAYHNTLMVQVWSMLATRNTRLARLALRALPPTPTSGAWITYLRCHDDIGWAIDDGDALAAGVTGAGHRGFLSDWYSGEFPGSWSDGLVFQSNPATGDRRISGTTASLAGLSSQADAGEAEQAVARILLGHAIVAGWGGIPVVWSGDELAMTNDAEWATEPGHEDDNRWTHRPRMDWSLAAQCDDVRTVPGRIYTGLQHLARVRSGLAPLHAAADTTVLPDTDEGILAVVRQHASGPFVGVYNVTDRPRPLELGHLREAGIHTPHDALSGRTLPADANGRLWLPAYAAWWVVNAP